MAGSAQTMEQLEKYLHTIPGSWEGTSENPKSASRVSMDSVILGEFWVSRFNVTSGRPTRKRAAYFGNTRRLRAGYPTTDISPRSSRFMAWAVFSTRATPVCSDHVAFGLSSEVRAGRIHEEPLSHRLTPDEHPEPHLISTRQREVDLVIGRAKAQRRADHRPVVARSAGAPDRTPFEDRCLDRQSVTA